MMSMKKFSVIIPCKNAEGTIRQCILSAANQTVAPCEIIVIDDGSDDTSLKAIQSTDAELKLIRTEGIGAAGARNAGLKIAQGDWIGFLDADDIWYPNHLSQAHQYISADSYVGYINHYDWLRLDGNSTLKRRCRENQVVSGQGVEKYIDFYVRYKHFVGMSACIINRERALQIGGFDKEMIRRHDIDFWLRIIDDRNWVFDPVVSTVYRKNNPYSLSSNQASAALYRFVAFLKNRQTAQNSPTYDFLLKRFALRALVKSDLLGTEKDRLSAHEIAYGYLNNRQKLLYNVVKRSPPIVGEFFMKIKWI